MCYQIKMYEMTDGKCPFDDWLNDLKDQEAQIAIDLRLERVKKGNLGKCDPVGGGVYELKLNVGPGYRLYFGNIGRQLILLLCAGTKKHQQRDIAQARRYFQDFKNQEL